MEQTSALLFDGANDYVAFGAAPGLGVQTFTLECWFNWAGGGLTANTGSGGITAYPLITKGLHESDNSNVDANFFLGIDSTTSALAADFEEYGGGQNYPVRGSKVVSTNTWHHAAVTYDGQTWTLYLDGVIDTSLTLAAPHVPRWDSIQKAGIAAAMDSLNTVEGRFAGTIDEARIWNVARSQAEIISTIKQQVTSGSNLVARWGMNEGMGTTIFSSVGDFPGLLVHAPTWVSGAPFNLTFDTTPPAAPSSLTATGGSALVTLSWAANTEPDLAGYNIYRGTSSGVYSKISGSAPVTGTTYNDASVTNLTEYFYVVRAVDNASNESGNSNEASAIPMTNLGAALQFDGVNDYVTFGNPLQLDGVTPVLGAQNFTIETWFKRTGTGVSNTTGSNGVNLVPLVAKGAPEVDNKNNLDENYILGIKTPDNVLAGDFETYLDGCNGRPGGDNNPIAGVTPILNDTWYHAAFTYDGAELKLYLNGKLENTLANTCLPRYDSIQQAALGTMLTSTGGQNGFFQGALDEVRIWNVAHSQSEILADINHQVTAGTGLIGRWGMNEGGGSTITDSVYSLTGTLTNGPNWVPGAPFNLNLKPGMPALVSPDAGATGIAVPATLSVHTADAFNSNLTVTFYGRPKSSPPGPDFSVVAIPDPQYYAATYPSIYNAQMTWVVNNKSAQNIVFAASMGDNVDNKDDAAQWTRAASAWDILAGGGVPYGLALGNHDGAPSSTANFNASFDSRLAAQPTFGGRYASDNYDNTYSLFTADGMKFIVLFIAYDTGMTSTSNPVLAWADGVLQANADRQAIVVTHDLLDNNSNFTAQGSAIYNALKANPNLFLMLSGHLDNSKQRSDVYNGHTVYSLRSDYQFVDSQQSGYLRILNFSPAANEIQVTTFSPTQAKSLTDTTNQFSLPYTMVTLPDFVEIGSTTVPAGQDATISWPGLAGDAEFEWYAVASNSADSATSPVWSFTTAIQSPTGVTLSSFTGKSRFSAIELDWETANEESLVGFNLYRSASLTGEKQILNPSLVPAANPGNMGGAVYNFLDIVDPGIPYYYWLEMVLTDGNRLAGPVVISKDYMVLLPMVHH